MSDSAVHRPAEPPGCAASWRFGIFLLQTGHALLRAGRPVTMGRRALDLLGALAKAWLLRELRATAAAGARAAEGAP